MRQLVMAPAALEEHAISPAWGDALPNLREERWGDDELFLTIHILAYPFAELVQGQRIISLGQLE